MTPVEAALEYVEASTKHVRTSPLHFGTAPKPALLAPEHHARGARVVSKSSLVQRGGSRPAFAGSVRTRSR